jgi:phosphoribosylanthranilate isomerase
MDTEAVSGVVNQWPILGLFMAGMVVAAGGTIAGFKIFGAREKRSEEKSGGDGILHAITELHSTVAAQGRATIEHIDAVTARVETRISAHEQRDNERFDTLFRNLNGSRDVWTDERREQERHQERPARRANG